MPVLRATPLDIYKLADACRQGKNPYDVLSSPVLMHQAGITDVARLTDIAAAFARWHTDAHAEAAATAFETIVRESGTLDAILASSHAGDTLSKLHALYDMLRSLVQRHRAYTLSAFVDHIRFIREHQLPVRSGSSGAVPGRVRLMTAHKSKGLEFDHVYIVGATDDHWGPRGRRELIRLPQSVFLKSGGTAESQSDDDERNLFYVALTRARTHATITYAQRDGQGRELLPVRFLSEIKPDLVTMPDTAPVLRDWDAKRGLFFTAPPAATADIADKAFLNDIFLRQGLSVTALNNYLACPWRYFYTNLIRIPEAPSFALMYGSAVDRALQEYFEHYRQGTDKGVSGLLESFRGFIRHQPFQTAELTTAVQRGERALSGWWEKYHHQFRPSIINQLSVPAVAVPLDGTSEVLLNGKMDRVDLLGGGEVVVTDYKTGKPKSRNEILGHTKDADGNYLRQLTFYNLLLDHYRDGEYRMTKGIIDFVDPDTKGNWHREEFVITGEQKAELKETIRTVAGEILSLAFWNRTCDDRECPYCRLRSLMKV
jgi:DNA helicase-2/ATP-dependent DNA helicase PcrA